MLAGAGQLVHEKDPADILKASFIWAEAGGEDASALATGTGHGCGEEKAAGFGEVGRERDIKQTTLTHGCDPRQTAERATDFTIADDAHTSGTLGDDIGAVRQNLDGPGMLKAACDGCHFDRHVSDPMFPALLRIAWQGEGGRQDRRHQQSGFSLSFHHLHLTSSRLVNRDEDGNGPARDKTCGKKSAPPDEVLKRGFCFQLSKLTAFSLSMPRA
jgi:hypothetical protein